MRVRALDSSGDMTFGQGAACFLVDSPQAVAQVILTRLRLYVGDWFLDLSQGTPWAMRVLGKFTGDTRDVAIKARILGTPDVVSITSYSSQFNTETRTFTVQAEVQTAFGPVTVSTSPASYQGAQDVFSSADFTDDFVLTADTPLPGFEVQFEQP